MKIFYQTAWANESIYWWKSICSNTESQLYVRGTWRKAKAMSLPSVVCRCTVGHKCLSQFLIRRLSCWINCQRNLFFPKKAFAWRVRWPVIYTSPYELDHLNHEEIPTISLKPGNKLLKRLPKISFECFKYYPLLLPFFYTFAFMSKRFLVPFLLYWSSADNSMYFRYYVPLSPFCWIVVSRFVLWRRYVSLKDTPQRKKGFTGDWKIPSVKKNPD